MSHGTRYPWLFEKDSRPARRGPLVKGGQGRTDDEIVATVHAMLSTIAMVVLILGAAWVLFRGDISF